MELIAFLEEDQQPGQSDLRRIEGRGCGFQRSVIYLMKGEFLNAFKIYPAIFTLILMMIFLGFHLKFNFAKGHKVLFWLFLINLSIILVNYILKLI